MKKDIEWLKDRILRSKGTCIFMRDNSEPHGGGRRFYSGMLTSIDLILGFIDQLDEPEVLSQEWIDKNKTSIDRKLDGTPIYKVREELLQNLIVPKKELPAVPKHVGEWITRHREKYDIYPALKRLESNSLTWEQVYKWYRMNTLKFVNAYLTGEYEVEEEPVYNVLLKPRSSFGTVCLFLYKQGDEVLAGDDLEVYYPEKDESRLTEQEIKDFDDRYWAFAKPVEEVVE